MLTRVDRVQVVVTNCSAAASAYQRLLGAEVVREDTVRVLTARRVVLRIGCSEVEILEPEGGGATAEFLAHTGGGLFAAGFTTPDVPALRAHLERGDVHVTEEGDQLFLSSRVLRLPGFRAVISADVRRPLAGLLQSLYEVTLLVEDSADVAQRAAATFGLDPSRFIPIHSPEFGYDGKLTLFHPDRLDRVEIVTPTDPQKTMGRYFAKRGACFYMCYAEADDLAPVRDRLQAHAPGDWTGSHDDAHPDNLFIHPKALAGMMMGVSCTSVAWRWSGHPERVMPGADA
jgi:Glyoxalase/Bleomycin resistance protein/Dioxygenase superfamily